MIVEGLLAVIGAILTAIMILYFRWKTRRDDSLKKKEQAVEKFDVSTQNQAKPLLIREAYKQHWLHARHVELERLMFTSILTVIIMGILVGIKDSLFENSSVPLLIFIMVISFFGILFTLKIACIFKVHAYWAKKTLEKCDLNELWQIYNKDFRINKWCRVSKIFPIYFLFFFSFAFSILIYIYFKNVLLSGIIFEVLFIIPSFIVYFIDLAKGIGSLEDPEIGQYD